MFADLALNTISFGILRICLRGGERPKTRNVRGRLFSTPVYQQIPQPGYDNGTLSLYAELLGTREALEGFCLCAAEPLRGRTLLFQEVGRWGVGEGAGAEVQKPLATVVIGGAYQHLANTFCAPHPLRVV